MHSHKPEFDLLKLRCQLEEILAMVKADHNVGTFDRSEDERAALSVHLEDGAAPAGPDINSTDDHPESDTPLDPPPSEVGQRLERDDLYDDALVVITEFGQASTAI